MLHTVLFSLLALADAQCLANGTHPSFRKLLVNSETGESYPVGITILDGAAAYATSYMAGILIQDLLGFNVSYTVVAGQVEAFFSVAGCSTPSNSSNRGCGAEGPSVTYQHLQMEAWHGNYPAAWAEVQKFATAPQLLGSMGYEGSEGMYFSPREFNTAYETEGLALDHWTGFDSTWKQPGKYFDNSSAVNRSELKPCSDTNLYNHLLMSEYLNVTGDSAGVVVQPGGKVVANCPDGYFWYSPSCRNSPTQCIVYFTGGYGWGLSGALQKATAWNMPLALGVGLTGAEWKGLPTKHKSLFYWWVPDSTFLEMSPVKTIFPVRDKQAWEQGDISTAALGVYIGKIVSNDLAALAPLIVAFAENIQLDLDTVNTMLLKQKTSGEDWEPTMCRWLQDNQQIWSDWIPDDSTCFPKFGLFNEITEQFVSNRDDREGLRCRACPSGTYSKQLSDDDGSTYICEACPAGTSQASGASLKCEPCLKGEYQDEMGQQGCKRCDVGAYQDEQGGLACTWCPANSRTLQRGSLSLKDCGCEAGYMNVNVTGGLACAKCSDGLSCPVFSTIDALRSGYHPFGTAYLPQIMEGYFSTESAPMEVYRCLGTHCIGGLPGACDKGTEGPTCDQCPAQMYMFDECTLCDPYQTAAWMVGPIVFLPGLFAAYYIAEKRYIVRASLFESGSLVMGLLLNFIQNLGILSTVAVPWPAGLKNALDLSSIFVLNLKSAGISCAVNTDLGQYMLVAGCFASVVILMPCLGCVTQLPSLRNRGLSWTYSQTISAMGKFLSTWFVTECNLGIAPFICFAHPNARHSVLKYPNTLCGSPEHSTMQWVGVLLLSLSLTHVILCAWALHQAPAWSLSSPQRLKSIGFLLVNFRPSCWWFGMVLLIRGPMLSIGQVIATDATGVQLLVMSCVLLSSLGLQTLFLPWKVPLVNLVDAISTSLFLMFLGVSLHMSFGCLRVQEWLKKVIVICFLLDCTNALQVCVDVALKSSKKLAQMFLVDIASTDGSG